MGWWSDLWQRQVPGSWGSNVGNSMRWTNPVTGQSFGRAELNAGLANALELNPPGAPDAGVPRTRFLKDYPADWDLGVANQPLAAPPGPPTASGGNTIEEDAQDFFDRLRPEIRDAASLTWRAKKAEDARILAQQEEAIAGLEDIQSRQTESYNDWLNDEQWQTVMDTLQARSSDDYDVISDQQEAAQRLTLAQALASESAKADVARGASGTVSAGANAHEDAALSSYFTGAGLQVAAQRDAINTAARNSNLAALGKLKLAEQGVNDAYFASQTRIGAMIADVRLGVEITPTDFLEISGLEFSMDAFDEALAQSQEFQAEASDQARFDLWDFLDMGLRAVTAWYSGG